ncbi:DUF4142 domain-containing protein [Luteolibacter sp. Populi]|uniref:DUF4142 domain-containing protein n=1 Tax=Luteolibacter sp. Populi TaxID=3230487 RepID=UPI0034654091
MKIPSTNTVAALLIAAAAWPVASADPAVQSSPDKRPTTPPTEGRGNTEATPVAPAPDDGPAKSTEKPGAGGPPKGGRANDAADRPMPDQDRPAPEARREPAEPGKVAERAEQRKEGREAKREDRESPEGRAASAEGVEQIVASWPERPQLGARTLIAKYGSPDGVTEDMLVWKDQGPFKKICISKEEHAHDFPKPHTDFMQHTVALKIPADKASELTKYDGSVTFDRTQGEISARCDVEGHNLLSLNLAHDIISGKLNAEQAREKFGEIVKQETAGEKPDYTMKLQFEPSEAATARDADVTTIEGAPERMAKASDTKDGGDAEILGTIVAVDESEIGAATVASTMKLRPEVAEYATMIHKMHGENLAKTLELGRKIGIAPAETSKVNAMREKNAGELAKIVAKDPDQFEAAFIKLMVSGHSDVLEKLDDELLKKAGNEELVKHLKATREEIAAHLEAAKKLQVADR